MPALVQVDCQRRHELGERSSIGRGGDNDIELDDPLISRNHAEVVRQPDGSYRVRDLGSRRGTYVGTRKVAEAQLRDGDELLIGPTRLRFEASRASVAVISESDELRKLRAVVELSRAIGVEHDLDRLLGRVLETCFQLLRADRGMIIVYGPSSKTPAAMVARTRTGEPVEDALSTSVLSQIMATREPFIRTEIDGDATLRRSESLSAQGVRSLVAVPLMYEAAEPEWLGVIHLDSQATNNVFQQRDLDLLGAVAGQAALAIKNAMLVRQVQSVRHDEARRLERMVAKLPVGVVVLDDSRRCILVNEWVIARAASIGPVVLGQVVEHLAGIACEGMTGTDMHEQATVADPETTFILNVYTSGDGHETVVVISDITEERAKAAKAAHQDRLALIGQLAGGIAHDFNNLLFIIGNYAGVLEESLEQSDARGDASMIAQAASSATELVRQLLAFSRREVVKPKVIDVASVVANMQKLLERTVGPRIDVVYEATAADLTSHHVLIDPSQLEQIVMNLVVNARDAIASTESGLGKVTIRVGANERFALLEVEDTGSGIAPEVAARVFEPYFTTKAIGQGTGLGLATVQGIVQNLGGEISLESAPGRGTTFRIALPKTDLAPEATGVTVTGPTTSASVLLVDDDDRVRRLTERMLRVAGYFVVSASCGDEALEVARRQAFDILLTDMVMPGMSGRDLARDLIAEHPQMRVVFMSGYSATPMLEWQLITKPFDRQLLLTAMGNVQALRAQS